MALLTIVTIVIKIHENSPESKVFSFVFGVMWMFKHQWQNEQYNLSQISELAVCTAFVLTKNFINRHKSKMSSLSSNMKQEIIIETWHFFRSAHVPFFGYLGRWHHEIYEVCKSRLNSPKKKTEITHVQGVNMVGGVGILCFWLQWCIIYAVRHMGYYKQFHGFV